MFDMKALYVGVMAGIMALMGMLFLQPVHAEYPFPVWTSGQPVDGSLVSKTVVSVSTNAAVGVSTNTERIGVACQFTAEGSAGIKVYWDYSTVVTSTASKWVLLGTYFTPDDPLNWQGPIRFVTSSSTATVVCHEITNPSY